jgi:hypothetical protein
MSTRRLLVLLLVSTPAMGCNPQGTCIMIDKSDDPAQADFCWVQYYESACRDTGKSGTTEVEFFKEDSTAGFVRCKDAGFTTGVPQPEIERKLESGDTVSLQRPKSVQ